MQVAKLMLVLIAILPFSLAAAVEGVIELARRRYHFARGQGPFAVTFETLELSRAGILRFAALCWRLFAGSSSD